jgi:hypothetical protein
VCASAVVMLDSPCSEVECETIDCPLPLSCVTVCRDDSTELEVSHEVRLLRVPILSITVGKYYFVASALVVFVHCSIILGLLLLLLPGI